MCVCLSNNSRPCVREHETRVWIEADVEDFFSVVQVNCLTPLAVRTLHGHGRLSSTIRNADTVAASQVVVRTKGDKKKMSVWRMNNHTLLHCIVDPAPQRAGMQTAANMDVDVVG